MTEIKKILPKNLSSGFITAANKKSRNTLFLNSTNNLNNQSTTPTKPSPQKNKTIRLASDDVFKKINNNLKTKRTSIKSSRIYLRLEERDEIEKIISEEEKKRYVNKEININKIINRDELKRRFKKVPFSDISNKKPRRKKYLPPKMKRSLSSISKKSSNEFSHTRGLISINKVLLQNFRSEGKNEIERSKKNFVMVNEFLKKVDEENMDKYYEIEKQFVKNKNNEEEKKNKEIIHTKILKSNNNKEKKRESIKIKESDFIKFKRLQMIKEKKFHRLKARIFDNMMKNDYQNYYHARSGESKYHTINYRLLSKTILMRNLMKQMKVATFKDEALNILQGYQSKKISDLANDKFSLENKDIYTNQSDNMYFFGNNKLKNKPIPHFLKVKFSMKTSRKFGEINGSCFGLPV